MTNELFLENPAQAVARVVNFLQQSFAKQGKSQAVVAVSGGIDSALSFSLVTKALGAENVTAVLLPYQHQSMDDARLIVQHLQIPAGHLTEINIQPMVDEVARVLGVTEKEAVRLGNIKARCRMICVYDIAKQKNALVVGTENKSEHYLGYFTRFGDAASDIEPICHLYKTQVRQLVESLQLPAVFLKKPPSAGLWAGQTDEDEMGFTYTQADQVLYQLIDRKVAPDEIQIDQASKEVVQKVVAQVNNMKFKLEVPYSI